MTFDYGLSLQYGTNDEYAQLQILLHPVIRNRFTDMSITAGWPTLGGWHREVHRAVLPIASSIASRAMIAFATARSAMFQRHAALLVTRNGIVPAYIIFTRSRSPIHSNERKDLWILTFDKNPEDCKETFTTYQVSVGERWPALS